MNTLIDDSCISVLPIIWEETAEYSGPKILTTSPKLRLIKDFLTTPNWQNRIRFIIHGVLNRHGRAAEYSGFTFPEDLDPGEEPFEGVMMFDPIDTIYLSEAAFDTLMNRYFQVIIENVTTHHNEVIGEEWWEDFVRMAEQLREKVK